MRLFEMPAIGGRHGRCPTCQRPFYRSRRSDPDTSDAAADDMAEREGPVTVVNPGTHKHRLLLQFRVEPLNAGEASIRAGLTRGGDGGWRRVSDLEGGGFVEPTGQKTLDPLSGKERMVHRITARGLARLAEIEQHVPLFDPDS